jgi:hypothetical protein
MERPGLMVLAVQLVRKVHQDLKVQPALMVLVGLMEQVELLVLLVWWEQQVLMERPV